jgi:hypothetical protein
MLHVTAQIISSFQDFQKPRIASANKRPVEYLGPFFHILEEHFCQGILYLRQTHMNWLDKSIYVGATAREDSDLYRTWQDARCIIEDFETIVDKIRLIQENSRLTSPKVKLERERYISMIAKARLWEQHARDDIQLNVGNLALRESRKSIHQADSIGRISFLAFVFLPLSLVISVFGMNIKQLTGSGASWKTFLISAGTLCGVVTLTCAWLWRRSLVAKVVGFVAYTILRGMKRSR